MDDDGAQLEKDAKHLVSTTQRSTSTSYMNAFNQFSKMSPPTTPTKAIERKEADTAQKSRVSKLLTL